MPALMSQNCRDGYHPTPDGPPPCINCDCDCHYYAEQEAIRQEAAELEAADHREYLVYLDELDAQDAADSDWDPMDRDDRWCGGCSDPYCSWCSGSP